LELLPAQATTDRVKLTAACAGLEHLMGRHGDARRRLIAALDALLDRTSAEAVALMIELAVDAVFVMEWGRIAQPARDALTAARALGDRPLTAAAAAMLAVGGAFASLIRDAEDHAAEASALIDQLPDAELAQRLDAPTWLGIAEIYLDRWESAVAHLRRGLTVARATAQGQLIPVMLDMRAFALFMLGRLQEAADLNDRAIEAARLSANGQSLCWSLMNRTTVKVMLGDLEEALDSAHESVDLADAM
jgi:tetratricopeptide (TPR) repeat protein